MRTARLALFLVFLGPQAMLAQQADDPDIQSKIIALEHLSKVQGWKTKDIRTLGQLLDEGFLSVNTEGNLENKSELLAFVQSADIVEYLTDSIVVRTHSDTAIATGIFQIRGLIRGKPFLQRGRFVDTWVFKGGRWLAVASLSTPAR
jgi:hypothetical protein